MAFKFNEKWYIQSKLTQLLENGYKDANGNDYTADTLVRAIKKAGYTLEEHYKAYADKEGTQATQINFDQDYYLESKLAQLAATGSVDANGNPWTKTAVIKAIHKTGLTIEQHYQKYSTSEGTSANAYFNTAEYLAAKLQQLQNNSDASIRAEWANKTVDDVAKAFMAHGMSAEEHYMKYGSHETDKDGKLINPSNAFDANAYAQAKLAELKKTDPLLSNNRDFIKIDTIYSKRDIKDRDLGRLYGNIEIVAENRCDIFVNLLQDNDFLKIIEKKMF